MTWPKVTEMFAHGNDSSLLCLAAIAEMAYNVMTLNLTLPDRKEAETWYSMQQPESLMSNYKGTIMVHCQDLRGMLDVDMFLNISSQPRCS